MLHYDCEVCGEKMSLLALESSGEDKQSVMCKCPKCGTQYRAPKVDTKKMYMLMIPLGIVCVLGYILFDQYFGANIFYGKAIIVGVFCVVAAIIFIHHIKNLKFEKIDEAQEHTS